MRLSASLLCLVVAGGSAVMACSSSSSSADPGCATNPFTCAAGTTCSAADTSGTFACLPSGPGAKGSACTNTVGKTTCGDTLVCLQLSQAGGQCVRFCENGAGSGSAHACASGETCAPARLQGTSNVFYICAGGLAPPDAGGSSDAATD